MPLNNCLPKKSRSKSSISALPTKMILFELSSYLLWLLCVGVAGGILLGLLSSKLFSSKPLKVKPSEAPSLFPLPAPNHSITTDNLDSHKARDHLISNKVLRYPYFQTMAHQPLKTENWIELDGNYRSDLEMKKKVIEAQGKVVLDCLPCVHSSCGEFLEFLVSWLCSRYPNLFKLTSDGKHIINEATNETLSLFSFSQKGIEESKKGTEALLVVSRLVQDDFLIAHPASTLESPNQWQTAGGLVAFPGFYLLSSKIGKSLSQTHAPVPQFNSKLLFSVERTLSRFKPSEPFERTSWEIVDGDDLFWNRMAGPLPSGEGDAIQPKRMTKDHELGRQKDDWKNEDAGELILRLDHQTFVKMPKSGSVFFGVHPMRRKLKELEDLPLVPALLLKIHAEGSADLMNYKAAPSYTGSVIPYLEAMHQRQIHRGLIQGDERPQDFREFCQADRR